MAGEPYRYIYTRNENRAALAEAVTEFDFEAAILAAEIAEVIEPEIDEATVADMVDYENTLSVREAA